VFLIMTFLVLPPTIPFFLAVLEFSIPAVPKGRVAPTSVDRFCFLMLYRGRWILSFPPPSMEVFNFVNVCRSLRESPPESRSFFLIKSPSVFIPFFFYTPCPPFKPDFDCVLPPLAFLVFLWFNSDEFAVTIYYAMRILANVFCLFNFLVVMCL